MLSLACVCNFAFAEKEEKPSMAFLEFLAELEKVDGEYVSPMQLSETQADDKSVTNTSKPLKTPGTDKSASSDVKNEKAKQTKKEKDNKEVEL